MSDRKEGHQIQYLNSSLKVDTNGTARHDLPRPYIKSLVIPICVHLEKSRSIKTHHRPFFFLEIARFHTLNGVHIRGI